MPAERNTVLVADDYDSLRRAMEMRVRPLLRENQTVVTAKDGSEALTKIAEMRDKLLAVLTDLEMPGADGNAVARAALDAGVPHVGIFTSSPKKVTVDGIRVFDKLAGGVYEEIDRFISEAVASAK